MIQRPGMDLEGEDNWVQAFSSLCYVSAHAVWQAASVPVAMHTLPVMVDYIETVSKKKKIEVILSVILSQQWRKSQT